MKARKLSGGDVRYLGVRELCAYLSVGQNTAREVGEQAGARIKLGKRVLFDRVAIDNYLESLRG